jgi:NAD(P)-dependent dehydrogenase (short-subunit alcohol dehydrogenase family)
VRELAGKVAVVTGAASGIGRAMAERFAAEGMLVVLADIEEEPLRAAETALQEDGADVLALVTDVSDKSSVDHLAQATIKRYGTAHLVCNNAGVAGTSGLSWELAPSTWEWMLGVNLWGVIHGIRAFVPMLVEQGEGHIVNTTSMSGLLGGFGSSPYTASKFAVEGLSESLRAELALIGSPVKVSVLCPGRIATNISEAKRNWPARLGPQPRPLTTDKLGPFAIPDIMRDMLDHPMDPKTVADLVVEGVTSERFLIVTHPTEVRRLMAERMNDLLT